MMKDCRGFNFKSAGGALCLFVLLALPHASGQEKKMGDEYDWRTAASKEGISKSAILRLEKRGVTVTGEEYKQIFTPYLKNSLPVFITSDSLLNAFHTLYDESIRVLELGAQERLCGLLKILWRNHAALDAEIATRPEMADKAMRRTRIVLGVALRLLDLDLQDVDAETKTIIEKEVAKIEAGLSKTKSAWLGAPDPGFIELDYSRFTPRGFYTKSVELGRLFRAVTWLQAIPFRFHINDELLCALILGKCMAAHRFEDKALLKEFEKFIRSYEAFVGQCDDWDIIQAALAAEGRLDLDNIEAFLRSKRALIKKDPRFIRMHFVNDQARFLVRENGSPVQPSFRILSACSTPDAAMFQRTTDPRYFSRSFPTGLELIAPLGSAYAMEMIQDPEKDRLLSTINACMPLFYSDNLYNAHLQCFRNLFNDPAPGAPYFMKNDAWEAKSCQTALCSWALMRRTFILHTKTAYVLGGRGDEAPVGFVEPETDFYRAMAKLTERTELLLRDAGVFERQWKEVAADIRAYTSLLNEKGADEKGESALRDLSKDEKALCVRWKYVIDLLPPWNGGKGSYKVRGKPAYYKTAIKSLSDLADSFENGGRPDPGDMADNIQCNFTDLEQLWKRLVVICRRLEMLSQKQLEAEEFNAEEKDMILSYGDELASIMLYKYDASKNPDDDAPRIVDVCVNPGLQTSNNTRGGWRYLEAGVGRPKALYVLYPWNGRKVLCRGAVMSYFEFPYTERLTDKTWKELLDSDQRPDQPSWLWPLKRE